MRLKDAWKQWVARAGEARVSVATYNCVPMPEANHRESSGGVLRFGEYELDPRRGVLSRGGSALKVQPQPLRVLELLVLRAPEVVTREELSDSVWGNGVNVDLDQSLNFCVRQIRSVLNDSASNPKFIDTLPKQGYRFIGDVVREAEQPAIAAVRVSAKSEALYSGSEAGIAVSGAPGQRQRSKMMVWSSGVVALFTLAASAYLVVASRNSIPPLRVSAYTQITTMAVRSSFREPTEAGSTLIGINHNLQAWARLRFQAERSPQCRWRCLARPWWMFPRMGPLFSSGH